MTDTNTLYSGSRHNAVDHIVTALEHGFDYTVTGAPIIISDGLMSDNIIEVPIGKKHFDSVKLARDIVSADSMMVLSHFKAHELTGFGGAIKNLAMGGAPAIGKKEQHACRMAVNRDSCIGCGTCVTVCPEKAIEIEEEHAVIMYRWVHRLRGMCDGLLRKSYRHRLENGHTRNDGTHDRICLRRFKNA